jgi:hypothetical protein
VVKTENECCDCGLPCIYEGCQHYQVTRYYCDVCGCEDVLYEWDDQQLCIDCIKQRLNMVEGSDVYF